MPNGRSGGFKIEKGELSCLVKSLPAATLVAKIIVPGSRVKPVDSQVLGRFVDECASHLIAIEEQDHKFYVIHLSEEPKLVWVMVGPEGLLFEELRGRHDQWTAGSAGTLNDDSRTD